MVDYLSDVAPMCSLASGVRALSGPVPDPEITYWLQVVAGLQRRMATNINITVEDTAAAGASDI